MPRRGARTPVSLPGRRRSGKRSTGCARSWPPRGCTSSARSTIPCVRSRPPSARPGWPQSCPMPRRPPCRPWEPDETARRVRTGGIPGLLAGIDRGQPPTAGVVAWGCRDQPGSTAVSVELPGLGGRRNLSGLGPGRAFDDAALAGRGARRRSPRAVEGAGHGSRPCRAPGRARPAGPRGGAAAAARAAPAGAVRGAARATERSRAPPVRRAPLGPPAARWSSPGRRGRPRIGRAGRRVRALVAPAAARDLVLSVGAVVLATGGIAGGGHRGHRRRPARRDRPGPAGPRPRRSSRGCQPTRSTRPVTRSRRRASRPTTSFARWTRRADGRRSTTSGSPAACWPVSATSVERCGDGVAIASGLLAGRRAAVPGRRRRLLARARRAAARRSAR